MMTREEMRQVVADLVAAPSCYSGLREVAQTYLAAQGSAQAVAAASLKQAVRECIMPLTGLVEFCASAQGEQVLGAAEAQAMLLEAKERLAKGEKYCFCPACTACVKILEHEEDL